MEVQARAGIDLYKNVLRYAEVEHFGDRCRLLRLGSCDFDFDVAEEVLSTGDTSPHIETLTEALQDVFAGSSATQLHVTLHPPGGYSFFTPLSTDLSLEQQEQRVSREVALLSGESPGTPNLLYMMDSVAEETLQDGRGVAWQHVWVLPERVYHRFENIFKGLPYPHHRMRLSMQTAAAVVERLMARQPAQARATGRADFSLAIGWYGTHAEYTLLRNRRWYFSHYAPVQSPLDAAYFAVTLLNRLGVATASVQDVYVYGDNILQADFAPLETLFGKLPERLNPMAVIDLEHGNLAADFDGAAYVPCIGAAL